MKVVKIWVPGFPGRLLFFLTFWGCWSWWGSLILLLLWSEKVETTTGLLLMNIPPKSWTLAPEETLASSDKLEVELDMAADENITLGRKLQQRKTNE